MARKCELCECAARMYCESDQASLCWDCDEKVHRANFLVAKHSRSILCHACQSVTPWKASGEKLGRTVSVCETCVGSAQCKMNNDDSSVGLENQSDGETDDDLDEEEEYEDDYDEDEEEDDENQVVPWSGDSQSHPPPPVSSSSSSSSSEDEISLKRMRDWADLLSDDEIASSTSQLGSREEANSSLGSFRPLKQPRTTTTTIEQDHNHDHDHDQSAGLRSTTIINSLHRLQQQMIANNGDASATILGVYRLSSDQNR